MAVQGRSEEGRRNRQAILDYLATRPERTASAAEIGVATKSPHRAVTKRLRDMRDHGEIVMRKSIAGPVYTALVTETRNLYPQREFQKPKPDDYVERPRKPNRAAPTPPHIRVHRIDDTPPIRNQGGQGSLRGRYSGGSPLASVFW